MGRVLDVFIHETFSDALGCHRHIFDCIHIQGQANRYIKNMGKDPSFSLNGIDVIKLTDKNFLRTLENGIRFGRWVLLENVQASQSFKFFFFAERSTLFSLLRNLFCGPTN